MSGKRTKMKVLSPPDLSKIDWTRFDATTDEEIAQQIADDPDTAPELTDEEFARGVWVQPRGKTLLSLRIDDDVLDGFRRDGAFYQQRINQVLRNHAVAQGWISPDQANASRKRGRPRKPK
ncbi:BrnA antitoxin family protein [Roseiterribacter gracilis]|uniref:CopG family transcriptional regulator n=1 Tax=Roseiterribacter gracilis TaxID=2812848 RepID=A0A8S8XF87_9PROT|nr:hypothetical protein TMPK1_35210 [Rhodospirillales bacterium TMPK1]